MQQQYRSKRRRRDSCRPGVEQHHYRNYSTSGVSYGSGGSANWYFAPTPDTVAAGTSVTFTWSGGAQHNIHFDAVAAPEDSIPTSNSSSVSRTFTTPGTYNYHCTIHPMSGVVVVH